MTLTEMAKQLNVSAMTIYRKLKKNGVKIDELRDPDTGELTAAGVSVIASLFDATAPQQHVTAPQQHVTGDATRLQQVTTDDATVLQAKLDGATALIEQLTSERDDLRKQVAALTAALQREQDDRQAERRLLTGNVEQHKRGGLFGWLRKKP